MPSLGYILAFFFPLSLLCTPCGAQSQTHTFQWTFADSSQQISTYLPQCQSLKLKVYSSTNDTNALGTPPYYLMAFEPGGFSTTSFVGTSPTNLSWQVNHAAGTQLLLSMADAKGGAGGMSTPLFTVEAAQDTSCLPPAPSTSLAITPNVTSNLSTCDPWGLTVTGGSAPYNVSLMSVGSTIVTNISIPEGFDILTYINRANPNGEILAAVSDSTGIFGKTSPIVNTVGDANPTCPGLVSGFGHSDSSPSPSPSSKSHRMTTAAIVCLTVGILALIVGSILFVTLLRRRGRMKRGIVDGQDARPRVWRNEVDDDSPYTALLSTLRANPSYRKPPLSDTMITRISTGSSSTSYAHQEIVPYTPDAHSSSRPGHRADNSIASSSHSDDHLYPLIQPSPNHSPTSLNTPSQTTHPTTTLPTSPTPTNADRRYAKLVEAHSSSRAGSSRRDTPAQPTSSVVADRDHIPMSSGSYPVENQGQIDPDVEPDIIIQHRDGGVVQELPPPYLDRYRDRPPPTPPDNSDVTES
ncbi:hypothetical protein PILCRDRAFT_814482 [Piloderma croceum F 1598]|uniref:Dystroglycan-type cadherin-like domain-containing protein n=1 Tax=Piloderma croceum (strain F 1598) TaxID=765440 RepID=A0A0C3CDI0_PILCF|nr:hypothetical protein PILCRDRAFT_814482 [Piloderma croceum F 1598]